MLCIVGQVWVNVIFNADCFFCFVKMTTGGTNTPIKKFQLLMDTHMNLPLFPLFLKLALVKGLAMDYAPVSDSELALGGIRLGDTEKSVAERLGTPIRRLDTGDGIQLDYHGLTIWVGYFENNSAGELRVFEMMSTSTKICTPSGMCPGDGLKKTKKVFGVPLKSSRETGVFLEYPSEESSCWLQLAPKRRKIASIRVACQP